MVKREKKLNFDPPNRHRLASSSFSLETAVIGPDFIIKLCKVLLLSIGTKTITYHFLRYKCSYLLFGSG